MIHQSRILMAEVDQGGNSAAPAPTAAVDVPQAQGATPAMSKEMSDAIASAVSSAVAGVKDSIFAEARRTFTATKQPSKVVASADSPAPVAAPFDPFKMRKLDFALNQAGIAADLTASQYERAHRDFASESPDDASPWVKDYFAGHAKFAAPVAAHAVTPAAPAATAATQRNAAPVSDRGSPPVSAVPLEDQDLLSMAPSDRDALRKLKGERWYTDKVIDQSRGRTFKLR